MQKIYNRINWENFPSEKTAVNEFNLNKMDLAIDNLDDRVVAMDASKVDLTKANELVKEILWNEPMGVLTVVKMNGSKAVIDTKLEKLAVNFKYDPQTQQLVITLDDGTTQNVDLSSLITEYEFLDSDTIAFEIVDGKVKANVKNGSITEDHLSPDYLGEIRTQVGRAEMSAKSADASEKSAVSSSALAKSYAVGGTGTRDGEDTDNAKYYAEQAKNASDVGALSVIVENHISNKTIHMTESEHDVVSKLGESAEGSLTYNGSEIKPSVATTESTGVVKPDGTTISVDEDGTLHGANTYELPKATIEVLGGIKPDGKTTFVNEEGVLSAKGGGATITPKPTVNPQIKNDDKKVVITWEDPTDTVIEGSTFSTWAGTKLVMKENGYPTSPDDGTVLVDNTTRDKYKTTGFEKSGLTNDKQYYFALFPYSTDGVYNYDSGNRLLGEPTEELKIVAFAGGTDEEIAKMIQAHYNNKIKISDYWAVGDMRTVHLSAMSATGVGESHRAQDVQFVIGDFEHDDLTNPINGHSKAAVTLLQKDCLMDSSNASNPVNGSTNTENGYMNSSNTNIGGWKNCARRTWCNNVFFAALPSAWQSMVKTVNKKTSVGNNQSTIETVQDKVFLAAEIEIFGSTTYSFAGEGTQYQYYKNATANRYKMPKLAPSYVSSLYWERSPYSGNTTHFCNVDHIGSAKSYNASIAQGVAPNLCI